MKIHLLAAFLIASIQSFASIPDSVFIRPVGLPQGGGLGIEWSSDGQRWQALTQGRILGSDFGTWGPEKKLYNPSLTQNADGLLVLAFQVNERSPQFAITTTRDLIHWRPQDYPIMQGVGQCLSPVITCEGDGYRVTFHNREGKYFQTNSSDLAHFTSPVTTSMSAQPSPLRVPYIMLQALKDNQVAASAKAEREGELARDNEERFAQVKTTHTERRLRVRPARSQR